VEVAYPMRTWSLADQPRELPHLSMSVVIPEPCLWEPETPFIYEGPVELWENGRRCDERVLRHGLRSIKLGMRGMRLNGRPYSIRGITRQICSEADAAQIREDGFNTLLTPDLSGDASILSVADQKGLFVLPRISGPVSAYLPFDPTLCGHPSVLGWILSEESLRDEALMIAANFLASFDAQGRLGVELTEVPTDALPEGMSFVVCDPELALSLGHIHLPKVILTGEKPDESESWKAVLSSPGILGWCLATST
jgi:hypothetical protein